MCSEKAWGGCDGVVVIDVGGDGATATPLKRSSGGALTAAGASATDDALSGAALTAALYKHCVTFLKRRSKIDVADGGKRAARKLTIA